MKAKEKLRDIAPEYMKRDCHKCKTSTRQQVKLYNPDNPEDGEVWECMVCKENTSWA